MGDPSPQLGPLDGIVDPIIALRRQAKDLASASGTQRVNAVEQLQEQVTFLQGQTVYAKNSTQYIASNENGFAWYAFDAAYDLSLDVMSGESGQLWVTTGALLSVTGTGGPIIGFDVVGSVAPEWTESAFFYSSVGSNSVGVGTQRSRLVTVPPKTLVTVRSRRGRNNNNPHTGTISIQYPSMSVTRLA